MSENPPKSAADAGAKRRLQLMPETLPAPESASRSSPRARTLAHMRRLLAFAATTGVVVAACTREDPSDRIRADDPSKKGPTPRDAPGELEATHDAGAPDAASDVATVTTSSATAGYLVVDMLPPPAKCAGASSTIKSVATWKASSTGGLAVEVHLGKSSRPDVVYSHKTPPTAYAATIVATSFAGGEAVITVVPHKGAPEFELYVPLECAAGDEHLTVTLEVPSGAPPKSGAAVKVSIYDTY